MKQVLLLDDARSIRSVFSQIVERSGYKAVACSNAREGMDWLNQGNKPDLVITDVNMPGMDGLTFSQSVRQLLKGTPILVMTTESDKRLVLRGKEAGITGWLLKPVSHEAFVKKLELFLGSPSKV